MRLAQDASGRLVVVTLLVVLVAVGLHSQVAAPLWTTKSRRFDAVVAGAVDAVAACLLVGLLARTHWAPTDQALAERLRRALRYVLGMAVAILTVTVLVLVVNLPPARPRAGTGGSGLGARRPHPLSRPQVAPPGADRFPLAQVLYGLAAAVLLLAIVAVAWKLRQDAHRREPEPQEPAQEYDQLLGDAVSGGRRALLQLDDARAAIIACYIAMEGTLARAGSARLVTETPDELLGKAASTLGHGAGAARRLTTLFYEARFSTHPMDAACRDDAEQALAVLGASLSRPPATSSAAAP